MMTHALSKSARVNRDGGFGDRFWYWRGRSGRPYIHSIYAADTCPPVPGAVYIAVRRDAAGRRVPLAAGRLPAFCGLGAAILPGTVRALGRIDEIHVHLLADDEAEACSVLDDLRAALGPEATDPARPMARDVPSPCRKRAARPASRVDRDAQLSLWPSAGEAATGEGACAAPSLC